MVGEVVSVVFVVVVSVGGGFGQFGVVYLVLMCFGEVVVDICVCIDWFFGINLFCFQFWLFDVVGLDDYFVWLVFWYVELGLFVFVWFECFEEDFEVQFEVVVVVWLVVISFVMGDFGVVCVVVLKVQGFVVIGMVMQVVEGLVLQVSGVDVVVVQGFEVGGYCGGFLGWCEGVLIGILVLVLLFVDVLDIFVIVVGGIVDVCGVVVV